MKLTPSRSRERLKDDVKAELPLAAAEL